MNPIEPAIITHDTRRIVDADERACLLFRMDHDELIDQPLIGGTPDEEMKWLIELRMKAIREKGELKPQRLSFLRSDGSVFWAECKTRKRDDGLFDTEIRYISEHLKP